MAVAAQPYDAPEAQTLAWFRDGFLRAYSQVLFSRSLAVGALLWLATWLRPRIALYGTAAVVLSLLLARLLQLSRERTSDGHYTYNALLVGLGAGAWFGHDSRAPALTAVVVGISVLSCAAAQATLETARGLPILTAPYLVSFYLLLLAAPSLGLMSASAPALVALPSGVVAPQWCTTLLSALGAIFFVPDPMAGALLLLALILYSRYGALLWCAGAGMGLALTTAWAPQMAPALHQSLLFNVGLTTLALGGVWFVPGPAGLLLGLAAGAACALMTLALHAALAPLALPVLILPFNIVVLGVLLGMRLRAVDLHPKAVDFLLGTPEQNLRYFRTRLARFGARYWVRFHAPFHGPWVCTQAVDGTYTHRGPFRHALDFEVRGAEGGLYATDGSSPRDFLCYRLPVLATADGTVARVIDGVADNAVGEIDTVHNWGNTVVLYHGPRLYSAVCHLSPGTLRVREGQVVRQGDVLGSCGSSGRSPRPHLHFQLQPSDQLGSPTLPIELHDVVRHETAHLTATVVPEENETFRNLADEAGVLPPFPDDGSEFVFVHGDGERERLVSEVEVLGARRVRSLDRDAVLYFVTAKGLWTVLDMLGDQRSVLYALRLALARLPAEGASQLRWEDHVPARDLLPRALRFLDDFVAPFAAAGGVVMRYRQHLDGARRVVQGEGSARFDNLHTRATLAATGGLLELSVTRGATVRKFTRLTAAASGASPPTSEQQS